MAIDMVRMPPELSKGFVRALDFGTQVIRLPGMRGTERWATRERKGIYWQTVKGPFRGFRVDEFEGFIMARRGSLHAFRFADLSDCSTNPTNRVGVPSGLDQFIGYGDGVQTRFPLRRTYGSTAFELGQRLAVEDRMLPIHGETDARLAKVLGLPLTTNFTAIFMVNSVSVGSAFEIDYQNRDVIFTTPPAMSLIVTGGYYYDWPVILGEDADKAFESVAESWDAKTAPNIPLECVPFERMAPETDDPGGAEKVIWSAGSPLMQKAKGKVKLLEPAGGGLSVTLEDFSIGFNSGGPHFILVNKAGGSSVIVRDYLTATTILTLSAGATAHMMIEVQGSTRNWFAVVT